MDRVRTSSKGAVVIPVGVRKSVGLEPGQMVQVAAEGKDRIVIIPMASDPVAAIEGILRGRGGGTVADFIAERRREDRVRRRRL
ncbi:MAG: AbrB/MazE/SpoVT family DNA-binding domain-containing protein [Planctomycetes bacterium]|nr:AbrB/MazE/SpoVT family DNA-binding domain-containing protein [Planctomycetota bacterium]